MSTTIDQKVVEMRFDNRQFESNVQTSLSTLNKLKQSLDLKGASKGLESVGTAAKGINLSTLSSAVETVGLKFNAMYSIADQALRNITSSAMAAGKRLVSAFTIDPIKTGLAEYETQINAVQTILANTESKGTTLDDVNKALDTLNAYADKTIYNFTEMTRNIGTFTAAGIDLETSTTAIQGIANLAAVSGSTSQQASTAMYQLSQALASGTVKLIDWNSVVNAGMGGQVFQDALKETARVHGVNIDAMIKKQGSFRETLKDGWLTSEILTETLEKFTMTTEGLTEAEIEKNRQMLKSKGYTEEQIEAIFKLGATATNAATKVKTFTQLMDTLKEAAQSGWTQTWEILVGDFEEAKELWTNVSDVFGEIINRSAEARNTMLQGWKDLGGRAALIDSIKNAFAGVMNILKPIGEAFREVFPRTTSEQLYNFTLGLKNLSERFKEFTEKHGENIKTTFKGIFSVIEIGVTFFKELAAGVVKLISHFTGLSGGILGVTASIGKWLMNLRDSVIETDILGKSIEKATGFISNIITGIKEFGKEVKKAFVTPDTGGLVGFIKGVWDVISMVGSKISSVCSSIGEGLAKAFNPTTFEMLNSGLLAGILVGINKFVGNLAGLFDEAGGILENITGVLDDVRGCFQAYQNQLNAGALLKIASAIAILTAAIFVISTIDSDSLATSLGAVAILFGELMGSLAVFTKLSGSMKGVIKASAVMITMSTSIAILAIALKTISTVDTAGIAKGLVAIGVLMAELALFLQYAKFDGKVMGTATGIVILSSALLILAKATKNFAAMSVEELVKGLSAVGVVLAELAAFTRLTGNAKHVVTTGTAMVLLGAAMKIFASAVKDFASMSWSEIGRGLTAMAGALAEVAITMNVMPKNMVGLGVGLVAVGAALKIVASALGDFGGMSWTEIGIGLTAMAGALGVLAIALNLMNGTLAGSAALVIATGALALMVPVLTALGNMTWGEIAKGLTSLAAAFAVIGVAGLVLTPLVPTILGLGAAFALVGVGVAGIGVGLMAAGAGLAAIATGFMALAAAGTAGATAIVAALTIIITGVANMIPYVIAKLGEGIIAFCDVLIKGAPKICEAAVVVITSAVDAMVKTIPKVADGAFKILVAILETISKNMPKIVKLGADIVVKFLNGIASNLSRVIQAGFNLLIEFINGITNAINTNTPTLVNAMKGLFNACIKAGITIFTEAVVPFLKAGKKLISSAIEGIGSMLSNIRKACKKLIDDAKGAITDKVSEWTQVGKDLINGMISGISDMASSLVKSAKGVVDSAIQGAKNLLGIKSPSRVFMEMGRYVDEGFIIGLEQYKNRVVDATKDVGQSAIASMSNTIAGIADMVNSEMDAEPTIRPVLDLSNIRTGTKTINAMFSRSQAMGISASLNRNADSYDVVGNSPATGNTYQFTQNNYSPKALSRIDIYRQTKNQISTMREVVNAT